MQEVFKNIIEKLEDLEVHFDNDYFSSNREAMVIKKDAIKIVKQEAAEYEECYKDCGECEAYNREKHHCPKFCKVITETVKENEENHNGWIPCSERLPSQTAYYLVTIKGFNRPMYAWWIRTEKKWYYLNSQKEIKDVTAWQPLPEPYQPKGE